MAGAAQAVLLLAAAVCRAASERFLSTRFSARVYTSAGSFDDFVASYDRTYETGSPEYAQRERLFLRRLEAVERQNSRPTHERLWTAGINWMSDYTTEEIRDLTGYYNEMRDHGSGSSMLEGEEGTRNIGAAASGSEDEKVASLPDEFAWDGLWTSRKENVRDQSCGNCWAMSTTAMLEAHNEIHLNFTRHYSHDEVTACAPNPWRCGGRGGCRGSIPELAQLYIQNYGLWSKDLEKVDCPQDMKPYWSEDEPAPHELGAGVRMTADESPARALGFFGWEKLPVNQIEPLKRALVSRGPATVGLSTDWTNYRSGIFDSCERDVVLSHSMMLLGYGNDPTTAGGTKYWLLQNSWGPSWGMGGKMKLLRRDDAEEQQYCGLDRNPEAGDGCPGGPKEVTVCGTCGILYHSTVAIFEPRQARSRENIRRYLGTRALEALGHA